jgi:hypothetical protein
LRHPGSLCTLVLALHFPEITSFEGLESKSISTNGRRIIGMIYAFIQLMIVAGIILYALVVALFVCGVAVAASRPTPQIEPHNVVALHQHGPPEGTAAAGSPADTAPLRQAA